MKLTALMVGAVLSGQTVIPKKADISLHYLDRAYVPNALCPSDRIAVTGPRFVEKGLNQEGNPGTDERAKGDGLSTKTNQFCIPQTVLANEREWAKSIFVTRVATGTKNEGTSFLISDNVIMTNNHIAVPLPQNPTDCRALQVLTRTDKPQWVDCEKIIYCNAKQDFCLVQMKDVSPGIRLGDLNPPLRINANAVTDQRAYLIGNSGALGIQGSKGPVVTDAATLKKGGRAAGEFIHYIPMIGGASGSPILDSEGQVIGINHSHSSFDGKWNDYVDPDGDTYNIATSMAFVYRDLSMKTFQPASVGMEYYLFSQLIRVFDPTNISRLIPSFLK
jgi:S1-C subfamily serine protease